MDDFAPRRLPECAGLARRRRSEPIRVEPKDTPSPHHSLYVVKPILSSPSLSSPRRASRRPVASSSSLLPSRNRLVPFFSRPERNLHHPADSSHRRVLTKLRRGERETVSDHGHRARPRPVYLHLSHVRVASVLVVAEHGELEGVRAQALALAASSASAAASFGARSRKCIHPTGSSRSTTLSRGDRGMSFRRGWISWRGCTTRRVCSRRDGHLADAHFLKLDVHEVGLRAVGLPVGVEVVVAEELDAVSGLGARHGPHRELADLAQVFALAPSRPSRESVAGREDAGRGCRGQVQNVGRGERARGRAAGTGKERAGGRRATRATRHAPARA